MHEPRFFTAAASAIALPLLLIPILLSTSEASRATSGVTWRSGFLSVEILRLLDSGDYEYAVRGDMQSYPKPEPEHGTWRRDGRVLVLQRRDGTERHYEHALSEGCPVLVPQEGPMAGVLNPYSVFVQNGDRCMDAVADARTRKPAPDCPDNGTSAATPVAR